MRTIEISHRTIIFTLAFLLGLWILWNIKTVLLVLFVTFLIATALKPPVERLAKIKVPRAVSILLIYVVFFGGIISVFASVIPPLVDQTSGLVERLPGYLTQLGIHGINQEMISGQLADIGRFPVDLLRFITNVFSNIVAVLAVLVLAFYLLLERSSIEKKFVILFGDDAPRARNFLAKLEARLGRWVRGELILMTIIAVVTYIGLRLLGIQFALPLALLAGLLEIVPNVGPLVAAIPAILVGFTVSPILGVSTAALYFLIQQVENSVIVPKVMQASVGLSPLVTLVALGVGAELGGIMGAILAVPILLVIQVILEEFFASRFGKLW